MGVKKAKPRRILFVGLTLELKKKNPERYEYKKIQLWEDILRKLLRPTKWSKPNKHGTFIHFVHLDDMEDWKQAEQELKAYVDEFNKIYNKTGSVED